MSGSKDVRKSDYRQFRCWRSDLLGKPAVSNRPGKPLSLVRTDIGERDAHVVQVETAPKTERFGGTQTM